MGQMGFFDIARQYAGLKDLFDFETLTPEEREKVRVVEHVAESVRSCDDATRKGVVEVLEAFPRAVSSRESG